MGVPRSAAHVVLGDYLRTVRDAAGRVQRDMEGYSSSHISAVENGCSMPSPELLSVYVQMGGNYKTIATLYAAARTATNRKKRRQRAMQKKSAGSTDVAANILSEFHDAMLRISLKIGGFSQTSYALIGQLEERLERRQAELDGEDPLDAILGPSSDEEWAGGF